MYSQYSLECSLEWQSTSRRRLEGQADICLARGRELTAHGRIMLGRPFSATADGRVGVYQNSDARAQLAATETAEQILRNLRATSEPDLGDDS